VSATAVPRRENRIDLAIQTEPYLQEVLEKAAEIEISTQTDSFLDRPPTPPFIRAKTGVDIETQVEDNDLFDFAYEVQPIVSAIVGKTLEQCFFEVHEEEELANVRRHKEAIEHRRNVELADVQRLEEAERRKFEEKQKRIAQRLKYEQEQRDLRNLIAAQGFGEYFVSDLMGDAISLLERRGYFYDEVEKEIEATFLPWIGKAMEEAKDVHELTTEISKTVRRRTLALEVSMKQGNEQQLDAAELDERKKRLVELRKVFVEDRGAAKIRIAMKGKKRVRKSNEEEDAKEGASDD
jgi:hypothetical protein